MAASDMDIPVPTPNQDCQGLLMDPSAYGSWLRKRSFRNKVKLFCWPRVYVVSVDGCVYYYNSEISKRPTGSFSLYGYNVIQRANDIPKKDAPWAFKIVHTHVEYKTYYFTASSEKEMKEWMKKIKSEMKRANRSNIVSRTLGDGQEMDYDNESLTYQSIETKIYDDPHTFKIPANYKNPTADEVSDEDDSDVYKHRGPLPPPLPARREEKESRRKKRSQVSKAEKMMDKLSVSEEKVKKGGLQRGKPDGDSMKVKVKNEEPPDDEEDEQAKYWESIYFKGQREEASEIIRMLAEEGVYMVRSSEDGGQVLVVFVGDMPKKYKINFEDEQYYLASKTPERFDSVEELCFFYYSNNLPTAPVKLQTPYQLHPDYSATS
ncbi:SH3 domain-binding protein 2-like [Gigantopelta aegis]|uniref:SH3 domain-binding protein 2-like n=1 Tax=Gigantopelta aegis TaxID=1735272 RepID=UPI001B8879FD|nr:SH3 domain-binding protein 2-like [Gigantopelta aegis]